MNFSEEVKTTLWDLIDEMSQNMSNYVVHPGKDFSRKKKWDFPTLMKFIISMESQSLKNELHAAHDEYQPEDYVRAMTLDGEMAPVLFRKLKSIATLIDTAKEIEDFQAIGVQCREVLIELGNTIYSPDMAGEEEQPQASNFKKKAELFVKFYLSGSENSDYRSCFKKLTEATWDYANKVTHSQTATFYEASTCVSLTTSLVGAYENIRQKVFDPLSQYICKGCKSKKLSIVGDESDENGMVSKLYLSCEECGEITEVIFEKHDSDRPQYIKGQVNME